MRHSGEPSIPQGSLVSSIIFAIDLSGLINVVEVKVPRANSLSFPHDVGWVATGNNASQVIRTPETCATVSIDWVERWELDFDTTKTEAALFTRRRGDKKHLHPKPTSKIRVRNGFNRFNREAAQ